MECPQGDSNSRFSLERAASWSPRRWGLTQRTIFYQEPCIWSMILDVPISYCSDHKKYPIDIFLPATSYLTNTVKISTWLIYPLVILALGKRDSNFIVKSFLFNEKQPPLQMVVCAPREIRTPVLALKGLRPGPLDDGGLFSDRYSIRGNNSGQG